MTVALPLDGEWLESDAIGGFASGTVAGYRTRRYHALLLTPRRPPSDRVVLVNGIEAWVDAAGASFPLSTQHYAPDVIAAPRNRPPEGLYARALADVDVRCAERRRDRPGMPRRSRRTVTSFSRGGFCAGMAPRDSTCVRCCPGAITTR